MVLDYVSLKFKGAGVHLVDHVQNSWTFIVTTSVTSNNIENSSSGLQI